MSFIVKGIDMPKNGLVTNINILSNGDIYVAEFDGKQNNYYNLKNSVIQIPKGHGRIGDLGKLAKLISEFGDSLKESARGCKLLITDTDLCYALALLTEHFQEYEPLLESEEE